MKARELAGQYPILGIGPGYETEAGYDETDYAGALWELLRNGTPSIKRKHDRDVLTRAAEMVVAAGPTCGSDRLSFSTQRWAEWLARNGIPWPRL